MSYRVVDDSVFANYDLMLTASFGRRASDDPYVMTWLRQLGAALSKATRNDVTILADGHVRLVVDYPSLGDFTEAAMQLEALKAMVQEDQAAGPVRAHPKAASSA
jgi:hypothetical protein